MNEQDEAEREAIERALAFANLGKVTDVEKVYEIFEGATSIPLALIEGAAARPIRFQRLHTPSRPGDEAVLHADLDKLEERLQAFVRAPQKARQQYAQEIAALVGKGVLVGVPSFEGGGIRQPLRYVTSGLEASCGYALALLFDRKKPFGRALKRCAWGDCEKWFLAFPRGGGGPVPIYHTVECQRAADAQKAKQRVSEYRSRQRAARRSKK